ncbi:MAG: sugar ABC transporter substrate-binding protein [Eubacteriales bacterium]|nr:sugar ABC transporter substrate-binding protein [Eubacteriales bacterium]
MKKIFALLLSLALLLTAAPLLAEEQFTIVVNLKTLSSEYWQTVKSGIDEAAEEFGLVIDVQGPAAETEIAEQVQQLETMLAAKPDAIIIAPLDGDAVIGAIESTGYEGIVIFCDTDANYDKKVSFVGTSNQVAAHSGGVYGIELAGGKDAKALIIYGQEGDNTSNLRKAGYEQALAEAGLEPVAMLSGNNTTDGATKVMEDQLIANPEINLVLCHNDDTAIGALNAVKAAGKEGITIMGFDGNQSAVELIASGDLAGTVAQQPKLMGYLSVETALKALKGEAVEANVVVDTVIIDKDNFEEFLAK